MPFLDTFFAAAAGGGGGGGALGGILGDQKGMASADTIKVDTGPTNVGSGSMSLAGGGGGGNMAWLIGGGLLVVFVLLKGH
jgi:hypothetical protein